MKIALISDLHANIYALEAVYEELNKENVERVFVLGDIIGYYYWPKEVIGLLRRDDRFSTISGNHERIFKEILSNKNAFEYYKKNMELDMMCV